MKTNTTTQTQEALTRVEGAVVGGNSLNDWRGLVKAFITALPTNIKSSSQETYTRAITQYFVWLQDTNRDLNKLTSADVKAYAEALHNKGLASYTIDSYLTSVKLFYEWAEAEKIYPNIAKVVKGVTRAPEHRKKHLAEDKGKELLEYFRNRGLRDFAIVTLKLRCGLRNIEVVRANIEDFTTETYQDEEGKTQTRQVLRLQRKGHTDKDGLVVLSDKAAAAIKDYLTTRKNAALKEPLFLRVANNAQEEGRLSTHTVSRICKEGLRAIGLDGREFSAHSLRHTTACMLLKHGGSITDVQAVLGHANPATTQIYTRDIEKEQRLIKAPELLLDEII